MSIDTIIRLSFLKSVQHSFNSETQTSPPDFTRQAIYLTPFSCKSDCVHECIFYTYTTDNQYTHTHTRIRRISPFH